VKGLHPILQRGCELAGGASELLEQKSTKARVWLANLNRLDQFFPMEKHMLCPLYRGSYNGLASSDQFIGDVGPTTGHSGRSKSTISA
jgi:hypothetical protein